MSSPGVERVVRILQDLDRFKDRSMHVKYVAEIAESASLSKLMVFSGLSLLTWKQNIASGV